MTIDDPLFPEREIADFLDAQQVAAGAPMTVESLGGGRSNAMLRVTRGDHQIVLRRPPSVAVEKADEGMRREFRILTALEGTPVPHPTPIALCDDPATIGCVFYAMECVAGVTPTQLPEALGPPEKARRDVTFAVTDALSTLHEVDWRGRNLEGFGRPEGFHKRQVERWTSQYESDGGRSINEVPAIGRWLDAHRPASWTPAIMHGDYHMLNVLIAEEPPVRVTAIVDWETATIGDPLLDLAGFCEVWCGAYQGGGWPERAEIVERYATHRGLERLPGLRYYEVLYNFRLGVLLEGVYQRSLTDASRAPDQLAADRAIHNFERAAELI